MQIKFKDGTIKQCTNPTEQKMYRNGLDVGWVLMFSITDTMTSNEADDILSADNIESLTFFDDTSEENAVSKTITGYTDVNYIIIKYGDDINTVAEIQLRKSETKISKNETE